MTTRLKRNESHHEDLAKNAIEWANRMNKIESPSKLLSSRDSKLSGRKKKLDDHQLSVELR